MTQLLTIKDVAGMLKLKPSTIYQLVAENKIPHCKIGRTIRFKPDEIDDWLDQANSGDKATS